MAEPAENPAAFKHWFNRAAVDALVASFSALHSGFDARAFRDGVAALETLELKDRVRLITTALHPAIGLPFPEAAVLLVRALPPPVNPDIPNQHAFWVWPLVHYVGRYGLDHPHAALDALRQLTQRMSAEFDIRPYLKRHEALTLAHLHEWATDPSQHVRRLVSEGTRTRLPWGDRLPAFIANPDPVFALLERLRHDPATYVRRSVANNLNDLAKDHPDRVIDTAARWLAEAPPDQAVPMAALVRHALRTLIKAGHPRALALLGHGTAHGLTATVTCPPTAAIGATLDLTIRVVSALPEPVSAAVDLVVQYASKGATRRTKVFKVKAVVVPPDGTVIIQKRLPMRTVSIREILAGRHTIGVQVNGGILAEQDVELVAVIPPGE